MKQGWNKKSLMEIASVSTGKWDANHATENGNYRFYTCAYDYLYCDTKRFEGECLILPGNGVNVGEVFYYDGEFDAYQRTYVISDIKILPKYLHYHMLLHWKALGTKQQYGSATNFIKIGNFKDYEVQYPLFPEQQRIVSILDEAFAAIAKAKANAEQNLRNARELFESYLQGVFSQQGEGWEEKRLGEVGVAQTGTTPKTIENENYGNFIPFIKPADVDFLGNGGIRYDNEALSEIGLSKGRKIQKDSILMVCIGATIGKVGITNKDVSCNQQINALTVKNQYVPKFIYYAMITRAFQSKVILEGKGAQATLPIINKSKWENLTVSFPASLETQQTIVRRLDALRAETQRLEAVYAQKLEDLEELKKSILQKAFAGELGSSAVVQTA